MLPSRSDQKRSQMNNEEEQRRSVKELALEEQKKDAAGAPEPSEPQNQAEENIRRKGKRKKDEYEQELFASNIAASQENPDVEQDPKDRIIEQLLDVLEVKDRKDLFSMPDEFQITDDLERITKPRDLATLRQKHKDGAYSTLEIFENDVYMVFQKAIESNAEKSVPYKEAKGLQKYSKQIFQSLRNTPTYAELELASWHQKIFSSKSRATSSTNAKKPSNATVDLAANAKSQSCMGNQTSEVNTRPRASSRTYHKRGDAAGSKSQQLQRRDTYIPGRESNVDPILSKAFEQPQQLYSNKNAPNYKESLLRFVEDAGPAAKMQANPQILEFEKQYTRQKKNHGEASFSNSGSSSTVGIDGNVPRPMPRYSVSSSVTGSTSKSRAPMRPDGTMFLYSHDDMYKFEMNPSCKFETDELVRLFSAFGTPMFFEIGTRILRPRFSAVPSENTYNTNRASTNDPSHSSFFSRRINSRPLQMEQNNSTFALNLPSAQPGFGELNNMPGFRSPSLLATRGAHSGASSSGQFASSSQQAKPGNMDPFAKLRLR